MTHSRTVSYAAMAIAVLALVLSSVVVAGGLADAAGRKIGKNLVVTKSIKNGAVTGKKVRDGSLTGADLAAGTITTSQLAPGVIPAVPAPTRSKSVGFAGCDGCVANGPNLATSLQLSGYVPGGSAAKLRMPVTVEIVDVNVFASGQTAGHSLDVLLAYNPPGQATVTTVPLCTVPEGDGGCGAVGSFAVPANYEAVFQTVAGPGGASGTDIVIGYTMRVP